MIQRPSTAVFALAACLLFAHSAAAAENFIQLYIDAKGGCAGDENPFAYVLSGPAIRAPFGKAAEDWSDEDLASLKTVLATCQSTWAYRANRRSQVQIPDAVEGMLQQVPDVIRQVREQVQARARQLEARRQMAINRIDKAAVARQQTQASIETDVARLEREAAAAQAKANDEQMGAATRMARAASVRDKAKARAAAIASLERRAQQDTSTTPGARHAVPGELSELEDEPASQSGPPAGPVTATTGVEAQACKTIDALAASRQQITSPQVKALPVPSTPEGCVTVAKGTHAVLQAAGATPSLRAFCVALERQRGCLWMAKAAFGPDAQP